jgi:hypothetical protein
MKVKSGEAAGPTRTPSAVAEPAVGRWPSNPSIYSIPTWVWLAELRRATGATVDLRSVPPAEWDRLAGLGVDAIWLLGVWERSPAGLAIANRNEELVASNEEVHDAYVAFREDHVDRFTWGDAVRAGLFILFFWRRSGGATRARRELSRGSSDHAFSRSARRAATCKDSSNVQ